MTEAPQPQFVWTCRQCGRKLPTRLDICRCGTRREAGSLEEPLQGETARPVAATPEGVSLPIEGRQGVFGPGFLNWAVLFAVAAIAIGALVAIQVAPGRTPAAPQRSSPPPPAQPANP